MDAPNLDSLPKAIIESYGGRAAKLLVGLAVFAALFVTATEAGADIGHPDWLMPPMTVSDNIGTNSRPQVSLGGNGSVAVVWERYHQNSGSSQVKAAVKPPGEPWKSSTLSSPGTKAKKPVVATSASGDAIAVWVQSPVSQAANAVLMASSRPRNGTWDEAKVISSSDDKDPKNPQVAMDGSGNAVVVWEDHPNSPSAPPSKEALFPVRSAFMKAGGSWGKPQTASSSSYEAPHPKVAVDASGNAVVVWAETHVVAKANPGGKTIYKLDPWGLFAAKRPAGANGWFPAVQVVPPDVDVSEDSYRLAMGEPGSAWVVWEQTGEVRTRALEFNPFEGGPGLTLRKIRTLSVTPGTSNSPEIATNDTGTVAAVWRYDHPQGGPKIAARMKPAGKGWSNLRLINAENPASPADPPEDPHVSVLKGGRAVFVWRIFSEYEGKSSYLIESRQIYANGSLSPLEVISDPNLTLETRRPQIASDPYGNSVAVWEREAGPNTFAQVIKAAALDGAGPKPPLLYFNSQEIFVNEGIYMAYKVRKDLWSPLSHVIWSFGDGSYEYQEASAAGSYAQKVHVYTTPGTYEVKLLVGDSLNHYSASSGTVTVKAYAAGKGSDGGEPGLGEDGGDESGGVKPGEGPGAEIPGPVGGGLGSNGGGAPPASSQPAQANPVGGDEPVPDLKAALGTRAVAGLRGRDFARACNLRITSPRLRGKLRQRTVRAARTTRRRARHRRGALTLPPRKLKRIVSGHGIKGTVVPGRVKGRKVACRDVHMALLERRGRYFSPPGLSAKRFRISRRRFSSKMFEKRVVNYLKQRFDIGRLRTKDNQSGGLRLSFKNFAAKRRQVLSRRSARNLRRRGFLGRTYYLKYSVSISGITVIKTARIKGRPRDRRQRSMRRLTRHL